MIRTWTAMGSPRQEAATRGYASRHQLKVAKIYREEAVPGSRETMDRPAWAAMMTALHSNGVKTILIEKLDRLSRSLLVQEATIAEFAKHGFRLISAHEPELMSDDPTRIAFRQMLGVFSQNDKSQIVLKLRAARLGSAPRRVAVKVASPMAVTKAKQRYDATCDSYGPKGWVITLSQTF